MKPGSTLPRPNHVTLIFTLVRQEIQEPPPQVDFGCSLRHWQTKSLGHIHPGQEYSTALKNHTLLISTNILIHTYPRRGHGCRTGCSSKGTEVSSQDQHGVSNICNSGSTGSDIHFWSPWELTYGTQTYMLAEHYAHKIKMHKNHFKIIHWTLSHQPSLYLGWLTLSTTLEWPFRVFACDCVKLENPASIISKIHPGLPPPRTST